jgi:hypothetical protein
VRWRVQVRLSAAALLMVRLTTSADNDELAKVSPPPSPRSNAPPARCSPSSLLGASLGPPPLMRCSARGHVGVRLDAEVAQVSSWLSTSVQQVLDMHARYPEGDYSWDAAHLWLAVSSQPAPSLASIMGDLPSKYKFAEMKGSVPASASAVRLLLNAAESTYDAALALSMMNSLRVSSDQTAYVAWAGEARAMEEPWQQLALLAMCQDSSLARDERVWRVAVYIGQGAGAAWYPWQSRQDALSLMATGMSLLLLDKQTDNDEPDVDVSVTLKDADSGSEAVIWEVCCMMPQQTNTLTHAHTHACTHAHRNTSTHIFMHA